MQAWKRQELPDSDAVFRFIEEKIHLMEQGKLKRARQVMDWCPLILKGICVRYMCRSGCMFIPTKETDWWILKTPNGKSHWHCPGCGQRYLYGQKKEYHTRVCTQVSHKRAH
jgi:hypothetical protein